jgi:hypothetical protein
LRPSSSTSNASRYEGQTCRDPQHNRKEVSELLEQPERRWNLLNALDPVRAKFTEPIDGLLLREAIRRLASASAALSW